MKSHFLSIYLFLTVAVGGCYGEFTFAKDICREIALEAESCKGINDCNSRCEEFWNTWTEPSIPSDCEETNQYCTEKWTCCPECIHKITRDAHCSLVIELGFTCDALNCGGNDSTFGYKSYKTLSKSSASSIGERSFSSNRKSILLAFAVMTCVFFLI